MIIPEGGVCGEYVYHWLPYSKCYQVHISGNNEEEKWMEAQMKYGDIPAGLHRVTIYG